eukprot:TRINITY_DN1414_c0_g1_i8.p1 TRINITY_DN1414_c0_g1~~TRINITY_DN1414_c0_g1_i8.p1  ORF type:complete len:448 (+),score=135.12 TRINITY_DN1414_c0_g1_i8:128-1471(+)
MDSGDSMRPVLPEDIAFLVLSFLRKERLEKTARVFQQEARHLISRVKPLKEGFSERSLHSILTEYADLKKREMERAVSFSNPAFENMFTTLYDLFHHYDRAPHGIDEQLANVVPFPHLSRPSSYLSKGGDPHHGGETSFPIPPVQAEAAPEHRPSHVRTMDGVSIVGAGGGPGGGASVEDDDIDDEGFPSTGAELAADFVRHPKLAEALASWINESKNVDEMVDGLIGLNDPASLPGFPPHFSLLPSDDSQDAKETSITHDLHIVRDGMHENEATDPQFGSRFGGLSPLLAGEEKRTRNTRSSAFARVDGGGAWFDSVRSGVMDSGKPTTPTGAGRKEVKRIRSEDATDHEAVRSSQHSTQKAKIAEDVRANQSEIEPRGSLDGNPAGSTTLMTVDDGAEEEKKKEEHVGSDSATAHASHSHGLHEEQAGSIVEKVGIEAILERLHG